MFSLSSTAALARARVSAPRKTARKLTIRASVNYILDREGCSSARSDDDGALLAQLMHGSDLDATLGASHSEEPPSPAPSNGLPAMAQAPTWDDGLVAAAAVVGAGVRGTM